MKVLFRSSYVDPGSGASIMVRLATRLKQDGHEVLILTPRAGFDSDIIKSVSCSKITDLVNRLLHKIVPNYFSLCYDRLLNEMRQFDPDIIDVHWTHGPTTIPIRIIPKLITLFPVFWTIHDLWPITENASVEDVL